MLIDNRFNSTRPAKNARGINLDKFKIQKPAPSFVPDPFASHLIKLKRPNEVMGYNRLGGYVNSSIGMQTCHSALVDMNNNKRIADIANNNRKRF